MKTLFIFGASLRKSSRLAPDKSRLNPLGNYTNDFKSFLGSCRLSQKAVIIKRSVVNL